MRFTLTNTIEIDLDLLIAQRTTLLELIPATNTRQQLDHIDGVINMMDELVDAGLDEKEKETP